MFSRHIEKPIANAANVFRALVITGPRQSGKTTLIRKIFANFRYMNLEAPDTLLMLKSDPRGFLTHNANGLIIDEAQKFPELFSYLQEIIDDPSRQCRIVLSGSQNFFMAEKISQTLAGRTAIFELLPLTYQEYCSHPTLTRPTNLWQYLLSGSYPRPYQEKLPTKVWYDSYIRTYLERDVRTITHVRDLTQFQLFLKFCAAQHGHELNATAMANHIGVSQTTVMHWLSILEASYVCFRLPPYFNNYKKRLSKRSKLYFYDTAIVCQLMGITTADQLIVHPARGAIFEGFVISELIKLAFAKGERPNMYYWREHSGYEVDLLHETSQGIKAYEIKSGATLSDSFTKGLVHIEKIMPAISQIIYGGEEMKQLNQYPIISWRHIDDHNTDLNLA